MALTANDMQDGSVKRALHKALADDGRLSYDEIADVIRSVLDCGTITPQERSDLQTISGKSRTIDERTKTMLNRFIAMSQQLVSGGWGGRATSDIDKQVFEFMRRPGNGVFPHIDRFEVGLGILQSIRQPQSIDQGPTSLCGAASMLFAYVRDFPDLYAKFVIDVYERGVGKLGELKIEPGADCRSYNPPRTLPNGGTYRAVDWVAMASIRDSENWLYDYQSVGDQVAGITGPSELSGWLKNVGYTDVQSDIERWRLVTKASASYIDDANRWFNAGYHVFLLINDQLMYANTVANTSQVARHWVVLRTPIQATPSVRFQVFSWGKGNFQIPSAYMAKDKGATATSTVTKDMLREHLFSVVAAKR